MFLNSRVFGGIAMRLRSLSFALMLLKLLSAAAHGQTVAEAEMPQPRLKLEVVETIPLNNLSDSIPTRLRCDADGNLYLPTGGGGMAAGAVRVSREGKPNVLFSLDSVPEISKPLVAHYPPYFGDFAITPNGDLYAVTGRIRKLYYVDSEGRPAETPKDADEQGGQSEKESEPNKIKVADWESHIVRFDADGKYRSTLNLDPFIQPGQIAALSSGGFFLAGRMLAEIPTKPSHPFAAMFDSRGQLIQEISFPISTDKTNADGKKKQKNQTGEVSIPGTAEAGDDGNIYLLPGARGAPGGQATVYVVSPGGEIVRTIRLTSPAGAHLRSIKVAGGRLIAWYMVTKDEEIAGHIFQALDAFDGRKLLEYEAKPPLGVFACYTRDVFEFLGWGQFHRLQLVRAKAR
jgi:hypothetical protein